MKKNQSINPEALILLTTIFSFIYFGTMKWLTTMPLDGMSFFIGVTATCLFVGWMIVTYVAAAQITEQEDAK